MVRAGGILTVLAFAIFLTLSLLAGIMRSPDPGRSTHLPVTDHLTMFTNLPFFPQQASAQAAQVDTIYFFMVAVTAFFSLLIAALVVLFSVKYRRRSGDEIGVAIHGSGARAALDVHPPWHRDGDVRVGAKVFFDLCPATGDDGDLHRRQAVDVEGAAYQQPTRDQRAPRPIGRPVKLVMGSKDVI